MFHADCDCCSHCYNCYHCSNAIDFGFLFKDNPETDKWLKLHEDMRKLIREWESKEVNLQDKKE